MSIPKLYAFPFSCSLAVHIALAQDEVPFEVEWVPRGPARKVGGTPFALLNPKQKVPTLVLEDGLVRTEIVAILSERDVASVGEARRREVVEWASFLATELHQSVLGPVFDPDTPQVTRDDVLTRLLPPVLQSLEVHLSSSDTLLGTERPLGIDAYLFWALLLLRTATPDRVNTPALRAFRERLQRLDVVREAVEVHSLAMANKS